MTITRAMLEDIMNNQPYGAGQKFIRSAKGKSFYRYVAKVHKRVPVEEIQVEVFSSEKNAFKDAQNHFHITHGKKFFGREFDIEWRKAV